MSDGARVVHRHCCEELWKHGGARYMVLSAVGPSVAYNNDLSEMQASENRDNPQRLSD